MLNDWVRFKELIASEIGKSLQILDKLERRLYAIKQRKHNYSAWKWNKIDWLGQKPKNKKY